MKRILVLLLVVSVFASSLIVPSYAAESVPDSVTDLLVGIEYSAYRDNSYWRTASSPAFYISGFNSAEIRWTMEDPTNYNSIVVCIRFSSQPSNVQWYMSTRYYDMYLINIVDDLYYYRIGSVSAIDQYIGIKATWDNSYTGRFNIVSVFGYLDNSISVPEIDFFTNAITRTLEYDEFGQPLDGFNHPITVDAVTDAPLPFVSYWYGPSDADDVLDYGEFYGKVDVDNYLRYADSATVLLFTCGPIIEGGAYLTDSSGMIVSSLDSTLTYCGESQILFELVENFERCHVYSLKIDLTGHYLRNLTLCFNFKIDRVLSSSMFNYDYGFFIQVQDVVLSPMTSSLPWYTIFSQWLSGEFEAMTLSISSGLNSVNSSIITWLTTVNQSLMSGFDRLASLLSPDADPDQLQDQVDNKGQELEDMAGIMDSVNKPALDSINTDLTGIVSAADTANIAHVYTMVIGDGFVGQIMTMVVVMAMMSFVLFGKR